MTPLTYWNWLVATWILLIISISTILSFQCSKKGKNAKPPNPATTPSGAPPNSTASKPSGGGAAPNPPAEADAADGHYEDVTVG